MIKKFSGIILYLLITLFVITIYLDQPTLFQRVETAAFDKLFKLRGKSQVGSDIQIIAIDDNSLAELGPWPWNEGLLAQLISQVAASSPKAIYVNLLLSADWPGNAAFQHDSLVAAIATAGNVIVPYRYSTSDFSPSGVGLPEPLQRHVLSTFDDVNKLRTHPPLTAGSIVLPDPAIAQAAWGLAGTGVSFDKDRVVRWEPLLLSYASQCFPTASLLIAMKYLDVSANNVQVEVGKAIDLGQLRLPTDQSGRLAINFNGPPETFKRISAVDILNGNIGRKDLAQKIAIIAFTGSSATDLFGTPTGGAMSSAEITANVVENIIHDNLLINWGRSNVINLILILGIGLFSAIILPRISLGYRLLVLGILVFLMINISFVLFTSLDMITSISYPLVMILFFMIASPTLKAGHRQGKPGDDEDEDEEIDYEKLLNATPLGGIHLQTPPAAPVPDGSPTLSLGHQTAPSGQVAVAVRPEVSIETGNFGRYRIIEPIGKGAMGMVYKGLDPAIDRLVALKTIRIDSVADPAEVQELRERLVREAKAAGKLSHPNIVTIYDVGEQDSIQYIAMEYLDGKTLESLLRAGHRWDYKTICKIMIQVGEALDFAHEHGIVHRDIKPANIMILEADKVKVMDFGIARFDSSNMTQSGVALGTPNYISPEQLKGQPADRRSDIFSAGVVFYELLTGERPFRGDTISALIYSILHTTPPPPSELNLDVPRIFDKIIAKALIKDPNLRFQTAREMVDILRKLI